MDCYLQMACVLPPAYDMADQRRFGPQHYLPPTAMPRPFYFTGHSMTTAALTTLPQPFLLPLQLQLALVKGPRRSESAMASATATLRSGGEVACKVMQALPSSLEVSKCRLHASRGITRVRDLTALNALPRASLQLGRRPRQQFHATTPRAPYNSSSYLLQRECLIPSLHYSRSPRVDAPTNPAAAHAGLPADVCYGSLQRE